MTAFPPKFQTIADDFAFIDEWDEKYRYLIDLGRQLAPLPEAELTDANKVPGCASQVWLAIDTSSGTLSLRGESDAAIVKGLVALMLALYDGLSVETAKQIDAEAALAQIDLADHITPQRANGVASMLKRIRAIVGA